jgi:hypothetical protein
MEAEIAQAKSLTHLHEIEERGEEKRDLKSLMIKIWHENKVSGTQHIRSTKSHEGII